MVVTRGWRGSWGRRRFLCRLLFLINTCIDKRHKTICEQHTLIITIYSILAFIQTHITNRNIHRFSFVRSSMRKILRILLSAPSARKVLPVPSKHRTSSFSAFSSILWANSNTELMISYGDSPRQGERRHGVFIYGFHWPICSKLIVW